MQCTKNRKQILKSKPVMHNVTENLEINEYIKMHLC